MRTEQLIIYFAEVNCVHPHGKRHFSNDYNRRPPKTKQSTKRERFFRQMIQKPQAILYVLTRIFVKYGGKIAEAFGGSDFSEVANSKSFTFPF